MEKNKERVLAYQLATDIDLKEMAAVTGGISQPQGWHITYSITGNPGGSPCFDVGID